MRPDATREIETAERALAQGDLPHALRHLAAAFADAPFDERVHAIFETVAARGDVLAQLPDDNYFGTLVLRAHLLRRLGRLDEAVVLLAQVAEQLPHVGFESVLASWLVAAKAGGGRLGKDAETQLSRLITLAGEGTIGLHRLLPGERALLAGFGDLAEAFAAIGVTPWAASSSSGMLRRVGKLDRALEVLPGDEGEFAPLQRGLVLRATGEGARAAEAFAIAAEHDPQDGKYLIEQARCWFVAGDLEKAREFLDRSGSDDPEVSALRRACAQLPLGDRVDSLDAIRRRRYAPLMAPLDATANMFRSHADKLAPGSEFNVAINGWESPSNRLAVALYGARSTDVAKAPYSLAEATLPVDPVSLRRGARFALWERRDGLVAPAVPAPPSELVAAIDALARESTDLPAMWEKAAALGTSLSPERAEELAAAMVHPPSDEAFVRTFPDGLFRHQVACACVLANLKDGWTQARAILESLVFGPVDWSSGAAIIALGEKARRDALHAREIRSLLVEAVDDLLPHTCEPRYEPLHRALWSIPGVPPSALQALREWHADTHGESESDPAPDASDDGASEPDERSETTGAEESGFPPALWIVVGILGLALLVALLAPR